MNKFFTRFVDAKGFVFLYLIILMEKFMYKKILLSLALVMSLSANFDDKNGEEFETNFGTVCRSSTKLYVNVNDAGEIKKLKANKGRQLVFKGGQSVGEFTFSDRLVLTHDMTREEFVQALGNYLVDG